MRGFFSWIGLEVLPVPRAGMPQLIPSGAVIPDSMGFSAGD